MAAPAWNSARRAVMNASLRALAALITLAARAAEPRARADAVETPGSSTGALTVQQPTEARDKEEEAAARRSAFSWPWRKVAQLPQKEYSFHPAATTTMPEPRASRY